MTDQEILHKYGSGTTDLERNKIVMQSENFVVIRTPGHADWAGVGMRAYYPAHTALIRKGEWCLSGNRENWYGRVSRKVLAKHLAEAEARGEALNKTHQDKEPTSIY